MRDRKLILLIVTGVFLWGAVIAIGAYVRYTLTPEIAANPLTESPFRVGRAVMILLFVNGFLAFWLTLLAWRRYREGSA